MAERVKSEHAVHAVRELFRPEGELAQALVGFERRDAQVEMAELALRALTEDRVVLIEAGTGTGKTLAYLFAAALSGKKVVISTATHALSQQILEKDLPIAERALAEIGIHVRVAEMKGLSNYLCRRRMHEALSRDVGDASLAKIANWARGSEKGDRAELPQISPSAWADVSSSPDTRIGASCKYFDECFVTRMRRDAEAADIIVTNHHLFFADLALRRGGQIFASAIPPYDAVIFDEAHKIEDVATEFFGFSVSSAKMTRLVRDAHATLSDAEVPAGEILRATSAVNVASEKFFAELPTPDGDADKKIFRSDSLSKDAKQAYFSLDSSLDALCTLSIEQGRSAAVDKLAGKIDELRAMLARICDASDAEEKSGGVCFVERSERSVSIGTSPVEVASILSRLLFERVPATVLTSATLRATSSGFSYVRNRLGAPADAEERAFESPFDYPNHAGIYIAEDLPDPRERSFESLAAARVAELVTASGGGAFVLTTSHRMRAAFANALRGKTAGDLIVQGESPKAEILARFRAREDNVLVATMGFWEGVDVRGRALRLVVLDKIPFSPPNDPLTVFRSARLEAEGKSPFADYALPEAALTLKQGFGRLIRGVNDFGVVAITDSRMKTKGYGKVLLRALPNAARLTSVDEVRAFYTRFSKPENA